ncbi:hypothetical protein J7426_14440 [Tropicibacter sp. R16_0]|uniref:hypothetical protein n=1 Tax=Tropicibacter sp. R16_0 TaxID=2821102 RepID=UPI001ADAF594|nr:hypothetical protein [Tropicibacter sp. R16_0]MBO9451469.1 hypothetical protein [Tropicibacter sp. R16_0]
MSNLIPNRETETRILALLQCTQAMINETDRLAAIIADLTQVDPSSETITEAVWNSQSPATAVMFLKGELPTAGGTGDRLNGVKA